MKKILSAALMVMATFAASAQTPGEVIAKYNEAGTKMEAQDFTTAITLFEEVVAMGDTVGDEVAETVANAKKYLPQLYVRNALALANAKEFEQAAVLLDKAVASGDATWSANAKKVQPQVYSALAATAWNAEDFATAAEYFQKAHELAPNDAKVTTQLAESYGKMKDYDNSFTLFRELIAGGGDDEATTALKGRMAVYMLLNAQELQENDADKAVEILIEAVELDDNPVAWELLINTAFNSENYDKIVEFGDRAAEAQTDIIKKSNVYSMLGNAYEKKGNNVKAIEAYRKVTAGPNAANAKAQVTALQAQ